MYIRYISWAKLLSALTRIKGDKKLNTISVVCETNIRIIEATMYISMPIGKYMYYEMQLTLVSCRIIECTVVETITSLKCVRFSLADVRQYKSKVKKYILENLV